MPGKFLTCGLLIVGVESGGDAVNMVEVVSVLHTCMYASNRYRTPAAACLRTAQRIKVVPHVSGTLNNGTCESVALRQVKRSVDDCT